jgi:hypothetical protein
MSEYQFVHFLAMDRPLDEGQLVFVRRQSSRAEITPWEFTNEYPFGDLHGDAMAMLRRGYDVHLHYANFGIRRLLIRLPAGLPCDRRAFAAFRVSHCIEWHADKKGRGGILHIKPEADAGTYDEELYDVDSLLPVLAKVRDLLIAGDLRPLYLAWLACNFDEASLEPPVPAGLGKLPAALEAMADFYAVSDDLLAAAAERSPPLPKLASVDQTLKRWIAGQSPEALRRLVRRFLSRDSAATRAETLANIRAEIGAPNWPTNEPSRTLAQLRESASALHGRRLSEERRAKDATRGKRLSAIGQIRARRSNRKLIQRPPATSMIPLAEESGTRSCVFDIAHTGGE